MSKSGFPRMSTGKKYSKSFKKQQQQQQEAEYDSDDYGACQGGSPICLGEATFDCCDCRKPLCKRCRVVAIKPQTVVCFECNDVRDGV